MKHLFPALLAVVSLLVAGCATPTMSCTRPSTECTGERRAPTDLEVAALFDRWNAALQSGDPRQVVANYAEQSILLPTVSNKPRFTAAEKIDYFRHFLEKHPRGEVVARQIQSDCNMAVDSGIYVFTFAKTGETVTARYSFTYRRHGGKWLIISHHSSAMPEP